MQKVHFLSGIYYVTRNNGQQSVWESFKNPPSRKFFIILGSCVPTYFAKFNHTVVDRECLLSQEEIDFICKK